MSDQFVALDVEATAMDPNRGEIIEIALVVFDEAGERNRFSSLVRPRTRLSLDIARLTGIDPSDLRAAPPWPEIVPTLRRMVAGRGIVGQSVAFDLSMIEASGVVLPNRVYDTYQLATLLLHDLPAYTLTAIALALGEVPEAGHRALADALTTSRVFRRLLARINKFDPATLELLAATTRTGGMDEADLFAKAAARRPTGPLFTQGETSSGSHEMAFLTARDRTESLRATGSRDDLEPAQISAVFAPGGPLSHAVEGYELRPQQEAMALAVARTLGDDERLLVEAGTGTGKSLAYLVPAVLHAVEKGETIVISTNTLALQDQLFRKDLPDLRTALGADGETPFAATVVKGRSNYLCLRQWFAWLRQPTGEAAEARLQAKILAWLGETTTGDKAELRLAPEEEFAWRHVAEEEGRCVAARCVFQQRNQCFLYRARRQAEAAHLVIVNHALLLSDVMAGSRVLPEYEHLIVDEAHHLEDQATNQFGFTVAERDLEEFAASVLHQEGAVLGGSLATVAAFLQRVAADEPARRRAAAATERIAVAMTAADGVRRAAMLLYTRLFELVAARTSGGYDRSLRLTDSVRRSTAWVEIESLWEPLDRAMRELDAQARWFEAAIESLDPGDDEDIELQRDELTIEVGLAIRAGAELGVRLQGAIGTPDPDMVYWLERSPAGDRVSVRAAPLRVGESLRERLFDQLRSVTLTSATLTTDDTFDYVQQRLGLERGRTLAVASPFDYQSSTLLYLVDDIPEPSAPGYQPALQETLIGACAATNGRALVLFTSHSALQATARAIRRPLEERGVLVLAQGVDGSARQLVERLRHSPNVVVLGTATFWEGVDIVGAALSLLVIAKLPFAVPSDPVFAARSELFDDAFADYAVPQAVLKFKQGFGRLIRSSHDRGICAVLDRRVLSRRYGASFVGSLPPCSVQVGGGRDLGPAAAAWIAGERGEVG